MRLAYFTPLPPSRSGIADYNNELLPYLARGAEITVFVEKAEELLGNKDQSDFTVKNAIHFDEAHRQNPFELCIYHQGNNPYHQYIYNRALQTPGLLVLHEHCLHHLIAWKTLARKDEDGYWNEMFFTYGRRGARMAQMRARGVGSEYQQFLFPLNRRLTHRSLGIIVHNAYAASQLEGLREETPVEVVPHHLSPKVLEIDRMDKMDCRRLLGIPEESWVIASLGFVTQSKRIPIVLAAFKKLLRRVPNAIYLMVGEDHWRWSVASQIEEMNLSDHVRITGYTSELDFFRYLKAVDVIVNLRYPTAGETSGTLIRALGAGKPVIVTDFGQFGELPDEICLKVSLDPDEVGHLYSRLLALAYRPALGERLGRSAAEWIREKCAIEKSATRYLELAERIINKRWKTTSFSVAADHSFDFKGSETINLDRNEALEYVSGFFPDDPEIMGYINLHRDRLIRTVELVPLGEKDQRLLDLSSYLQMPLIISRYGNYGEISVTNWWKGEPREKIQRVRHALTGEELSFPMKNVDVERDPFPFPDNYFDVALCCELIEHLREDPMHMLVELNRIIKWGGIVILTTPNITSAFSVQEALGGRSPNIYSLYNRQSPSDRHSREYTPSDVRIVLEAAGFKVIELFTENVWHRTDEKFLQWLDQTGVPRELRGDNIYAVGRKQSDRIDRYPHELYD